MSKDGRFACPKDPSIGEYRQPEDPQHVNVYLTNPDILYSDSYVRPRMSG